MSDSAFNVDEFLAEPHNVQVATNGPTVRTLSYQWEDGCFWIINGPWSKLLGRVQKDPKLALIVDVSDYDSGRVCNVMASGEAVITPYDIPRARRMLRRYHGPDEASWSTAPTDYTSFVRERGPPGAVWLMIKPKVLKAFNFSYASSPFAAKTSS